MRVTGGVLRGRRLKAPAGRSVRPTTDRVRESLFAILGSLEGARVLDLFAGSGALGIEALSRGAVHADFVEQAAGAIACMRSNLEQLALGECSAIRRGSVQSVLGRLATASESGSAGAPGGPPYDLVLMDPPYGSTDGQDALERLIEGPLLARNGVVVFEASRRHPPGDIPGLALVDRRTYGDTLLLLLERAGGCAADDEDEEDDEDEGDPMTEKSRE